MQEQRNHDAICGTARAGRARPVRAGRRTGLRAVPHRDHLSRVPRRCARRLGPAVTLDVVVLTRLSPTCRTSVRCSSRCGRHEIAAADHRRDGVPNVVAAATRTAPGTAVRAGESAPGSCDLTGLGPRPLRPRTEISPKPGLNSAVVLASTPAPQRPPRRTPHAGSCRRRTRLGRCRPPVQWPRACPGPPPA